MVRKFKSAKVQLTLTGDQHPKGVSHLFNNLAENAGEDKVVAFTKAIELLTTEECTAINTIVTDRLDQE